MNRIQIPIYELNNIKVVRDNVVNLKVKTSSFIVERFTELSDL